ncbi:hypothetical protein BAL199_27920 [alpha proteobacterium BAL199]|jgi:hypothetical protein|nr:hypothetical protein BAL199_27920 [alpha proteobacterium BAL199]
MVSELADRTVDSTSETSAVAAARVRVAVVLATTLAAILILSGITWAQVAARFDTNRVHTEGETIRNAMSGMLSMGLPLGDFIGFQAVSARVLRADPAIQAVIVRDRNGQVVLSNPNDLGAAGSQPALAFTSTAAGDVTTVDGPQSTTRLAMPIVDRFGPAGSLELIFERALIHELTRNAAAAGLAAIVLLATGLMVHCLAIANPEYFQSRRDLIRTYAATCVLGIGLVVSALIGLTAEKAEETAGVYAQSLGARLTEAVDLGISLDDLSGLDDVVREYRDTNSVIGYVALLEGNRIATSTGLDDTGGRWSRPTGYVDAAYEVRPRRLYTPQYRVRVGIRWSTALRATAEAAVAPIGILVIVLILGAIAITRARA